MVLRLAFWVCAFVAGAMFPAALCAADETAKTAGFAGSDTCIGCHTEAGNAWRNSHHGWAWRLPTAENVLGDFNNRRLEHKGVTSVFTTDAGAYFVETLGPDGTLKKFKVVGTIGVAPLQQYIVETEPGRQQALDLVWDVVAKRWYHLYPDQTLPHTSGLHWTGPYKTWNARCAECHATDYKKNYAPLTRRYSSTQAEIGVGCEACHGPGTAHTAWAGDPGGFDPAIWGDVTPKGFTFAFDPANPKKEIAQCGGCHARRETIGASSPMPGTAFDDSYRLALLRDGLYHADGQISDEVYVHGSFLQSKMYQKGVTCTNCHTPHAATLKAEGNGVCTQCHSLAGNGVFPTLTKTEYDSPEHHFHTPGTDGAQCKNCHMIERTYMGIDGRRDHSFRVPRPDLSVSLGTPNSCSDCHTDKTAAWAAAALQEKFPDSRYRGAHPATAFAEARAGRGAEATAGLLLEIAVSSDKSAIVRATALDLLRGYTSPGIADRTAGLLRDPDALVRAAAISLQRSAVLATRLDRIGPMFSDPRASVRIQAARESLDIPVGDFPPALRQAKQAAMVEYWKSLAARSDFPETQFVIAGTALTVRNFRAAERAFSEAMRMDPQLTRGWVMIARIRSAQGDQAGALRAVRDGLAANPRDAMLSGLLRELGGNPNLPR